MDRVLGVAQAYIVGLEAPIWLKKGLQDYSNRPSFKHRVEMLIGQGEFEGKAVEMVLNDWARHLWMEYVD